MYNGSLSLNTISQTEITTITPVRAQEQVSTTELWQRLYEDLSKKIKKHALKTWFSGASIKEIVDDYVVIRVSNEFSRNFISQSYLPAIEQSIREVSACNYGVRLIVEEGLTAVAENVASQMGQMSLSTIPQPRTKNDPLKLKNNFTLDNFIINKANRLSLLFVKAFIDAKSDRYRALMIHGSTGLGKTHLLHAIANRMLVDNSQLRVKYISAETFANELFEAIRAKNTQEFHNKYRKLDLLLLDDAQFLENKKSTQEEFYYTFEAITAAGGKVVMAANKNPAAFNNIEANLKSRLTSALVTEIFEHDYEARMEILRAKAKQSSTKISDQHLQMIATKTSSSVRELEAAIDKLSIFSEFGDIDDESIVNLFGFSSCSSGLYKGLDIDKIGETVAAYFGIGIKELRSTSRVKELTKARHIAVYLSRELLKISHERIGKYFSGRKHSSIIHSIQLIQGEISRDRSVALVIDDIKSRLCG